MRDLYSKRWKNNTLEIEFSNNVDRDEELIRILIENNLISRINDIEYKEPSVDKIKKINTKIIDNKILIFEGEFIRNETFKGVCKRYSGFSGEGKYYNYDLKKINFELKDRLDVPKKLLTNIIIEVANSTSEIFNVSPDLFAYLESHYPDEKQKFIFYKNLFSMALFSNKMIINNDKIKLIYFDTNEKNASYEIQLNKYNYFKNDSMYSIFDWFCTEKIDDFVKKEIIKHFFLEKDNIFEEENIIEKIESLHELYISNKSKQFFEQVKQLIVEQHSEYRKLQEIHENVIRRFSTAILSIIAAFFGLYISLKIETSNFLELYKIIERNKIGVVILVVLFIILLSFQFMFYCFELIQAIKYQKNIKEIYKKHFYIKENQFDEIVNINFICYKKFLFWIQLVLIIVALLSLYYIFRI